MKQTLLFTLLMLSFVIGGLAQEVPGAGSYTLLAPAPTPAVQPKSRYELKQERIRERWSRLVPTQNKLQFAGSMGMFSGSLGWYYGRKNQWETDFFLGFIPKMNHQKAHVTITLKQTYTPWRLPLNQDIAFEPFTAGIYINKIFGQYFWNELPERYPENYYFWATNLRINFSVGQAMVFDFDRNIKGRELSFFYEFSTNDLYLISVVGNKTITPWDIIGLSLGLRYRIL